jgi:hypothetical protein
VNPLFGACDRSKAEGENKISGSFQNERGFSALLIRHHLLGHPTFAFSRI